MDFILNKFNKNYYEYLNVINSGNLNINILIISFLFGENNGKILYKIYIYY